MALIQSTAIPSGATDYEIDQSLRFNDDDAAYLNRTPSSAGNRKTWTWSGWVKTASNIGAYGNRCLFDQYTSASDQAKVRLTGGGSGGTKLTVNASYAGNSIDVTTAAILRDSSGWYHLMAVVDTTQATSSNRCKLYINGSLVTDFDGTPSYPAQNSDTAMNQTAGHYIGTLSGGLQHFDGYLAEMNFIDGTALTPSSFGETGDYGEWKPKRYSGSYGTNGFYLDFADSSALGDDESGNTNDWTANNFTASDQVLDSPTQNFATFNVLDPRGSGYTFAEGNLYAYRSSGAWQPYFGTMGMPSGKWYWEAFYKAGYDAYIGAVVDTWSGTANLNTTGVYTLYNVANGTGYKYDNGVQSYGGAAWHWSTNKILQVAYDADTGKMWIGEENTWYSSGNPSTGANPFFTVSAANRGNLIPAFSGYDAATKQYVNFGQDSSFAGQKTAQGNTDTSDNASDFYYTPPTDFLALNVKNLPEPDVVPSEHFNTVLYTGNDAVNSTHSITGVGFLPSFVWTKDRDAAYGHYVFDAVRGTGVTKGLRTNIRNPEGMANQSYDALSSFDSDGFTITGSAFGSLYQNRNNASYVSWNWKANGSGVANTTGSINSTVSANADSGFSIVSWTGNEGDDESIGHGLSKPPEMMISKVRGEYWTWAVYHKFLGTDMQLLLSETTGHENTTNTDVWADTAPTSSVFYVGNYLYTNSDSREYIGYLFHSVDGFSKVTSYIGNGSADGTFVYLGFRPMWIMVKQTNVNGSSWAILDTKRNTINPMSRDIAADDTAAEYNRTTIHTDVTANGIKFRGTNGWTNASGGEYIMLAFAETPFKYSNAR